MIKIKTLEQKDEQNRKIHKRHKSGKIGECQCTLYKMPVQIPPIPLTVHSGYPTDMYMSLKIS